MHIEQHGSGPQLFFGLHGWSGDHRTFDPLLPFAPDSIKFFSADLPGCGASPPPQAWTLASVVDEITDAIRTLPRPVTLVGNCSGANLALFVAKKIPGMIERIVTIDAFAYWPWYFRIFTHRHFGRHAYRVTFQNPLGRWLTNLSLSGKRQENTSLTRGFTEVDHATTYRYLALLRDAGAVEQLRGLAMPIDIAWGERSFHAVAQSAALFRDLWPQSRSHCLPQAGHLPIIEAAEALGRILFHTQSDSREVPLCTTSTAIHAH